MGDETATRRDFVKGAVAAGAAAALPLPRALAIPDEPVPTRKALFVYGGWEGHEPAKCRDLFVPWLKQTGFEVVVSDTQEPYADPELMKTLDLVVQIWTMGTIKKEALRGLLDAVKAGTGIAGWHGGLGDAYRQETEYEYMVGGNWVAHPGGIIDYEVNVVDHDDPITAGLKDFKLQTEQYFMHVNPNNKVLATTRFSAAHDPWIDGCTMPVAWKKVYGRGRVFYTSMGHSASVFDTPEALEIARRGIRWAGESRHATTPLLVSPVYPSR
jgi:uncharacterized protein